MMPPRFSFPCVLLFLIAATCLADDRNADGDKKAADVSPLEIVPAEATATVAIRDFAELSDRGDEFIEKTQIQVSMRFSDAYRFVIGALGVRNGVDIHGSAALFQLGNKPDLKGLAIAIPMKDVATMATNLNIPVKEFVPGRVIETQDFKNARAPYTPFIAVRAKHLVMGFDRDVVREAANGRSLAQTLSKEIKSTLSRDDILIFVRGELAKEMIGPRLNSLNDPDSDTLMPLLATADELDYIAAGVRLDDGFGGTLVVGFEGEQSEATLERLARGTSKASMIGLPDGQLVAAHAGGGDGDDSASATQAMLQLLMKHFSFSMNQMTSEVQRSKLMSVFNEAWQRADGSCSALYQNAMPQEQGAFSLVTILRTDDGDGFVRDMSELIPFVNSSILSNELRETIDNEAIEDFIDQLAHPRYRVRQLASTKLILVGEPALPLLKRVSDARDPEIRVRVQNITERIRRAIGAERKNLLEGNLLSKLEPQLAYLKGQETRGGRQVDFMQIRLVGSDRSKTDDMKRLFGPDWQTIRLAVVENDVVLLLGSDASLMDKAIENLGDGKVGISRERFASFRSRTTNSPKVEFHVGLAQAALLMTGKELGSDKALGSGEATSVGLTVMPKQIRFDAFSPYEDVKTLAKRMGW